METAPVAPTHQGVDFWRQLGIFDPLKFKKEIHVIGAGAIGSHFIDTIASMGINNITVYDFDTVEAYNLPNQVYGMEDVGMPKVDALKRHIKRKIGYDIRTVNEKVEKLPDLSGILVLCPDSMSARRDIFASARMNRKVSWVIDVRMGIDAGRIYFFDPCNKLHIGRWLDPNDAGYDDSKAQESPCTLRAISTTAKVLAGLAAHRVIIAESQSQDSRAALWHETHVSMDGSIDLKFDWNETRKD